ncbi:MAG: hypothetical protein ACR2HP_05605 [Ilumatobacteraceae bacterium]
MARPVSLTLAVVLWSLSCLAGLLIVAYFVTRLDGVRLLLEPVIRERDPDISQSTLDNTVITVIIASLGLVGLFVLLELWLALLVGSQRNWARVLLILFGLIGLTVTVATCLLLTDGGLVARRWLLATLGAQVLLALIGTITMYLPEPNRWFRMRLRHD